MTTLAVPSPRLSTFRLFFLIAIVAIMAAAFGAFGMHAWLAKGLGEEVTVKPCLSCPSCTCKPLLGGPRCGCPQ